MVSFCFIVLSTCTFLLGSVTSDGGVTNPKCGSGQFSVPGGEGKSFFCRPPLYGRYVTIRSLRLNDALTLCEVEVYSERRGMTNSYSKIWNLDQEIQLRACDIMYIYIFSWVGLTCSL